MDSESTGVRTFGSFTLDIFERTLCHNGSPVPLALKDVELLICLVRNSGHLMTKDDLISELWADSFVDENNLSRHIYILRKTLERLGGSGLIETVPRRGYRFVGEVDDNASEELLIERRSFTRTVVEQIESSDAPTLMSGRGGWRRRWFVVPAAALVLMLMVAVGATLRRAEAGRAGGSEQIRSMAVLPFQMLDRGAAERRDGLGLADDLITRLSNIRGINVRPTSSVTEYENTRLASTDIGRKLDVDAVLEGTVFESGDKVRVTMRLMSVVGGKALWSGQFERSGSDRTQLQNEIVVRVADALALNLTSGERAAVSKHYTEDDEAYQIYQKGRFEWNKRSLQGAIDAERLFRNAIERDPKFALAYVGLADQLATRSDASEAYVVIEKALELDPDLGEAHATLGFLKMFHEWDWAGADRELRRAIELDPGYVTAHHWYATLLVIEGRNAEARAEFARALAINPVSYNLLGDLGQAMYFDHDYDAARESCRKALAIYPDFEFAHIYLSDIAAVTGDPDEFAAENLRAEKIAMTLTNISDTRMRLQSQLLDERFARYKKLGYTRFLRDILGDPGDQGAALSNARIYALLGEHQKALDNLEIAVQNRSFTVVYANVDPIFDGLRGDPRFAAIVHKMNL